MSKCRIFLENYSQQYFPGATLKGRVECYFKTRTNVKSIKARLICREHTFWTQNQEVSYSSSNDVISKDYQLLGPEQLEGTKHIFPFTVILPQNIPPTFSHQYGTIWYLLQGIVERSMSSDYRDSVSFTVYAPIDFNKMPRNLQESVILSRKQTICLWLCRGDLITMDLELPKSAFVPDEVVNFKVHVRNMSNWNINRLDVIFTQTMKFLADFDSKQSVVCLAKIEKHGVGAHGECTYHLNFKISKFHLIPNFVHCRLFKCYYFFKVVCHLPFCIPNLEIFTDDLIVGHVPWAEEHGNNSSGVIMPMSAPQWENVAPSAPLDADLPPSYDEAVDFFTKGS